MQIIDKVFDGPQQRAFDGKFKYFLGLEVAKLIYKY